RRRAGAVLPRAGGGGMSLLADAIGPLGLASAYWRTRALQRRLRTRAAIESWQQQRVARWRRTTLAHSPFYRDRAGQPFGDLPIVDKATLMRSFADFNTAGVSAEAAWVAIAGSGRVGDCF